MKRKQKTQWTIYGTAKGSCAMPGEFKLCTVYSEGLANILRQALEQLYVNLRAE